jgi:outer membrane protein OmpA-like peptidoglycan-associated protein
VTLTADWIANTYTVTYDWNGSSGTATSPSTFTVGISTAVTLPVVGDQVRSNHSFDGWSLTRNGAKINSLTYTPSSSLILYAIWNKSIYTITYGAQGGSVAIASAQIEADGAGVILPAATKSNFYFKGWYDATTGGNFIGAAGTSYLPTSSISIYAQWIQSSLAGFTEAELGTELFSGTKRASGVTQTFTFSTSGDRSYTFVVPGSALPNNTALNFYQVASPSSIAQAAITDPVNYILSVIVSWLDPTGAVPDTADGKPIKIIVSDPAIKRGAVIYGVVAGVTQRLATATANGTVTVEITQDPEIIVAKTKPSAPRGVSASDSTSGISTVAWTEPATTGGDDISIYQVTASPGGATCITTTTSCQITGLSDTTRYSFTVDATNSVGTGSTSLPSNLINAPVESSPSPSPNNPVGPTVTSPIFEKTESSPIKNEQPSYAMQKIGTIYFSRNSYFLDLKSRKELQRVINLVNKDLPIKVLVYGHTDVTTGVNNLILSRSRAKAVEKYMSTKINGPKISTGWYASSKPAIKGSSATALAKNRRVDIYILY